MTDTWNKGNPPHIGWWLCMRESYLLQSWRWWNGKCWSYDTHSSSSRKHAANMAAMSAFEGLDIRWNDYYPENARVPRKAP